MASSYLRVNNMLKTRRLEISYFEFSHPLTSVQSCNCNNVYRFLSEHGLSLASDDGNVVDVQKIIKRATEVKYKWNSNFFFS